MLDIHILYIVRGIFCFIISAERSDCVYIYIYIQEFCVTRHTDKRKHVNDKDVSQAIRKYFKRRNKLEYQDRRKHVKHGKMTSVFDMRYPTGKSAILYSIDMPSMH